VIGAIATTAPAAHSDLEGWARSDFWESSLKSSLITEIDPYCPRRTRRTRRTYEHGFQSS
jgi:hypothetical protein